MLTYHKLFSTERPFPIELFSHVPVWEALETLLFQLQTFEHRGFIAKPHVVCSEPDQVTVGAGTVIEPFVHIQGPCIIGPHCHIGSGALIRGGCIIGAGCTIGHGTELKHSIVYPQTHLAHFNYVGDSIVGARVNMGAGVKIANLRQDKRRIRVFWEGESIDTGMQKLGALVGDGANVGCNAVLNPGTVLLPGAVVRPLQSIAGEYP